MTVTATLLFTAFAVLIFGTVLTFAAIVDRHRVKGIKDDTPERIDQPAGVRYRWLHRGRRSSQ